MRLATWALKPLTEILADELLAGDDSLGLFAAGLVPSFSAAPAAIGSRMQPSAAKADGGGTASALVLDAGWEQAAGSQSALDMFNPTLDDRPADDVGLPAWYSNPLDASGTGKSTLISQYYSGGRYMFSGNQDIDATLIGSKWTITALTYSFPTSGSFYGSGYLDGRNNLQDPFSAQQQTGARYALSLVAQYTNLSFTETTETPSNHANLRYSQTRDSSDVGSAEGQFPSNASSGGDIWFGETGQPFYSTPAKGNWGLATIMHETGHALGLKHGHSDYTFLNLASDLKVAGTRYGSQALPSNHDGQDWSLMTYRSNPGATVDFQGDGFNQPQTFMQNDIAALQYLYGANYATQSGNTTYSWSQTTGEEFINGVGQGAPTSNKISMTIWDGNGTDTYDLSNYTSNLSLNLNPGAFSTFSTNQLVNHRAYSGETAVAAGNVANALRYNGDARSLIENAIGGTGNDTIIGNAADNTLKGGGGNDTLDGQGGINTAVYTGTYGQYTINKSGTTYTVTDKTSGRDGKDTLTSIQRLQMSDRLVSLSTPYDFNGDGRSDLLLQNADGSMMIQTVSSLAVSGSVSLGNPGATWHVIGSADLNADGGADILLQNSDGTVVDYLMNGTTIASGALLGRPGVDWHVRGMGDFNNDGRADIVLQDSTGSIVVWNTNGSTVTGAVYIGNPGATWTVEGVADLNGDGQADLLLQNTSNQIVSYLMNGTTIASGAYLGNPGATWTAAGTGDYNGDGKGDILLHANDGRNLVWETNGTVVTSAVNLGNPGASYTGIVAGIDLNADGASDLVIQDSNSTLVGYTLNTSAAITAGAVFGTPGAGWDAISNVPTEFINGTASKSNATLTATVGADQFDFTSVMAGPHYISGFNPAQDTVALSKTAFPTYAALKAAEAPYQGGTFIGFGTSSALVIQGFTPDQLSASNFVLR